MLNFSCLNSNNNLSCLNTYFFVLKGEPHLFELMEIFFIWIGVAANTLMTFAGEFFTEFDIMLFKLKSVLYPPDITVTFKLEKVNISILCMNIV